MTGKETKSAILPNMVDGGKICDSYHMISTNRKYHVESKFNSTDEYLCEKNLRKNLKK